MLYPTEINDGEQTSLISIHLTFCIGNAGLNIGESMVERLQKGLAKQLVKQLLSSERRTRGDEEVLVVDLEGEAEVDSVEEAAVAVEEVLGWGEVHHQVNTVQDETKIKIMGASNASCNYLFRFCSEIETIIGKIMKIQWQSIEYDQYHTLRQKESYWFNRSFDFSHRLVYPVKFDYFIRRQNVPRSCNQSTYASGSTNTEVYNMITTIFDIRPCHIKLGLHYVRHTVVIQEYTVTHTYLFVGTTMM
jgi:Txe/YoeB family toxin of Txe-Axe toxin-antitoxin module